MIVMMAGLPGAGKTTLARELARRTGGRVRSKDEIRQTLFSADEIEYSTAQDDYCVQVMLQTAAQLFRRDSKRIRFLDGRPFSRRYQIDNVVDAAVAMHQGWRIVECVCSEAVARDRLEKQSVAGSHPAANRGFQLSLDVRARFEAITLPKVVIDSEMPLQECVDIALREIPFGFAQGNL